MFLNSIVPIKFLTHKELYLLKKLHSETQNYSGGRMHYSRARTQEKISSCSSCECSCSLVFPSPHMMFQSRVLIIYSPSYSAQNSRQSFVLYFVLVYWMTWNAVISISLVASLMKRLIPAWSFVKISSCYLESYSILNRHPCRTRGLHYPPPRRPWSFLEDNSWAPNTRSPISMLT